MNKRDIEQNLRFWSYATDFSSDPYVYEQAWFFDMFHNLLWKGKSIE